MVLFKIQDIMIWDTKLAQSLSWALLFVTPWTVIHQAPLFLGFSRQEYWSGQPFPSPGDLHDPGMEPMSPALADIHCTTWEADPILNDSCCKVLPHYKLEVVVTEEYFLAVQIKKGITNSTLFWQCFQLPGVSLASLHLT